MPRIHRYVRRGVCRMTVLGTTLRASRGREGYWPGTASGTSPGCDRSPCGPSDPLRPRWGSCRCKNREVDKFIRLDVCSYAASGELHKSNPGRVNTMLARQDNE